MKFEPFSKLPKDALRILFRAYESKDSGWDDNDYKACYLAFTAELKGESVSAEKFDALVRFWGNSTRNKTYGISHDIRNRTRLVPNKMYNPTNSEHRGFINGKTSNIPQSPFASAYSKDMTDVVDYYRKAMLGENLV